MAKRPSMRGFPRDEAHIDRVYSYHSDIQPSPRLIRTLLRLSGAVFKPTLSIENPETIDGHLNRGSVILIACRHQKLMDPFVFGAAAAKDPTLIRLEVPDPKLRFMAKRQMWQGRYWIGRPVWDYAGAVPIARSSKQSPELAQAANSKGVDLFATFANSGFHPFIYVEGTRYPEFKPENVKNGIGRAALQALANAQEPGYDGPQFFAVMPMSIRYPENSSETLAIRIEDLIPIEPGQSIEDIRMLTAEAIQDAVIYLDERAA